MFMKEMSINGFLVIWVLCFIGYVFYLRGVLTAKTGNKSTVNLDSFFGRIYGITGMNVLTAVVLIIAPIVLYLKGLHWYWITTGVITTLILQTSYLTMMRVADRTIQEEVTKVQKEQVAEMNKRDIEFKVSKSKMYFKLSILANLTLYTVIILNAWDILPIRAFFLPPIMPLYFHILIDWVQVGSILLGSLLMLIIVTKQMEYIHLLNIKTNNFSRKKLSDGGKHAKN